MVLEKLSFFWSLSGLPSFSVIIPISLVSWRACIGLFNSMKFTTLQYWPRFTFQSVGSAFELHTILLLVHDFSSSHWINYCYHCHSISILQSVFILLFTRHYISSGNYLLLLPVFIKHVILPIIQLQFLQSCFYTYKEPFQIVFNAILFLIVTSI